MSHILLRIFHSHNFLGDSNFPFGHPRNIVILGHWQDQGMKPWVGPEQTEPGWDRGRLEKGWGRDLWGWGGGGRTNVTGTAKTIALWAREPV